MLEVKNLNKYYKNYLGSVQVLKDIDLQLPQGEIVGLFGENGAGKSTFFKCILQFVKYSGEITLDGEKINHSNIGKIAFATCEHSFFPNLTAESHREFYEMHFAHFRKKRYEALMDFFELPKHQALKSYSTGQKNQFEVILALCQGADYILLDEPFSGNDMFNREDFYKILLGILEPQETIILSTHLIEGVENFVGRAVLIRKGQVLGDVNVQELEERGQSLVQYIKEVYQYKSDRVMKALDRFEE